MDNDTGKVFLEDIRFIEPISALIAENLFGNEQFSKIVLRFRDLKDNFLSLTYDECTDPLTESVWKFSSGITPYRDYDDTSNVPIPISNSLFENNANVISFDFPVWFNLQSNTKIMIITQDPMPRDLKWYGDCRDAICSTTFGIHNKKWREKGNGGGRMWLLIQSLINFNIGVYITDCKKFYIQSIDGRHVEESEEQLLAYTALLKSEIENIKPSLIVVFGEIAKAQLRDILETIETPVLELPHFSGQAQGKIKKFFNSPNGKMLTIENQAELYCKYILSTLNHGKS